MDKKIFFNIPYVVSILERFKYIIFHPNIVMSYTGLNNLHSLIRVHKDILPMQFHKNVVYRISCLNCDVFYVNQTGRLFKTRINIHRNHIKRNTSQHSITDHELDWENVEIMNKKPILYKRLLSECYSLNDRRRV